MVTRDIVAFSLILAAALAAPSSTLAGEDPAIVKMREAMAIVSENCGDAYPLGREVLEDGIARILAGQARGHATAESYRVLACGYATINDRWATRSSEKIPLAEKERTALLRAAELDPGDIGSRLRLAQVAPPEEQLALYESVLRVDPDHALALYATGHDLAVSGRTSEGVARLERAADLMTPEDAAGWGSPVISLIQRYGSKERADRLVAMFETKLAKAKANRERDSNDAEPAKPADENAEPELLNR